MIRKKSKDKRTNRLFLPNQPPKRRNLVISKVPKMKKSKEILNLHLFLGNFNSPILATSTNSPKKEDGYLDCIDDVLGDLKDKQILDKTGAIAPTKKKAHSRK